MQMPAARPRGATPYVGLALFVALAVVGLYIVKWHPYALKAQSAAGKHTLGSSIITGKAAQAPDPSLDAAITYARVYFNAIWKALVLGLLLAATIEALLPRDWLLRLLGSERLRTSAIGGVLSLPGMM